MSRYAQRRRRGGGQGAPAATGLNLVSVSMNIDPPTDTMLLTFDGPATVDGGATFPDGAFQVDSMGGGGGVVQVASAAQISPNQIEVGMTGNCDIGDSCFLDSQPSWLTEAVNFIDTLHTIAFASPPWP